MVNDAVISNNSKHNNCSNHKPLTGLPYDNNQTTIPKLLLVIIYFSTITIITSYKSQTRFTDVVVLNIIVSKKK